MRVDPVLLPAAMPGDRHLGPDARDVILALHEPFPRREHGAPAGARRHGLEPMYIPHGGEPPLVHPRRRDGMPVHARRGRAIQRTGHCVARRPGSFLVAGQIVPGRVRDPHLHHKYVGRPASRPSRRRAENAGSRVYRSRKKLWYDAATSVCAARRTGRWSGAGRGAGRELVGGGQHAELAEGLQPLVVAERAAPAVLAYASLTARRDRRVWQVSGTPSRSSSTLLLLADRAVVAVADPQQHGGEQRRRTPSRAARRS